MNIYNIGIPQGTRLAAIQIDRDSGELFIWTAIKNAKGNPSKWEGTRIVVRRDGSVDRITDNPDGSEDWFSIKRAD
jgi:hypothetical protein